jgi:hypothetical protein
MPTKRSVARLSAAATLALLVPVHALAAETTESITGFLRAFHADPARMMERLPDVVDENGDAHPQGFLDARAEEARHSAIAAALASGTFAFDPTSAAPPPKDDIMKLVEPGTTLVRTLGDMQAAHLTNLTAPIKPWADSYWPTYRGQIAYRYADSAHGDSKVWADNYAFATSNPASNITSSGDGARISLLSPAEKYDYIMGDTDFSLTNYSWSRGRVSEDDGTGGVATWMGICHGWSAAASMGMPFIGQNVTVISTNGIPVTFYPQDIKALQSMRWANGAPQARFVGGRCKVAHPTRNSNGRILDDDCWDVDPATWHLAVVNQLGKNGRGFVFDGDPGVEVWNFPLQAARYRYFNPQTFEETASWDSARVPMSRFTVDKFRQFRSKDAVAVVGIYMDITYPIEIEPGPARVFDEPTKTVRYVYDLELDGANNIIGGEWYSNAHPDFIWTFDPGAQAMAFDENVLLSDPWANNGPVPMSWTQYAKRASAKGVPLYAFLKKVVDAAGPVHQK